MWKVPLVFLAALVLGYAAARKGTEPAGPDKPAAASSRASRPPARWQPADFVKWIHRPRASHGDEEPLSDDFKGWTDADLHAALEQGLGNPETALEYGTANELMTQLFGEWTKRDFDSAQAWIESLPSEAAKARFAATLGQYWPKDRAGEGLQYVIDHRDWFISERSVGFGPIVALAIEDAGKSGPAAMEELLRRLRANRLDPRYTRDCKFPPGFDFAALSASPELLEKNAYVFYAGEWLAQDRDAAFDHLMTGERANESTMEFFRYVAAAGVGAERARWIAGKLDALDPDQRRQIALAGVKILQNAPETLATFAGSFTDPEDRRVVRAAAVGDLLTQDLGKSLEFLNSVPDPEERLTLLETAPVSPYRQWLPTAGPEAQLREKLATWNTTPERIDGIVRHLKEVQR